MNKENQNIEWKSSWRDEYLKWIAGFAINYPTGNFSGCSCPIQMRN